MNLVEASRLAHDELQRFGLADKGWKIDWDNARSRNGQCRYGTKTLSFSRILTKERSVEGVHNTILHEIAHALVGPGHGHNNVWRSQFLAMGGSGSRCSNEEGIREAHKRAAKWEAFCKVSRDSLGVCNRLTQGLKVATCKCHNAPVEWVDKR